jgi:hypothetical protein
MQGNPDDSQAFKKNGNIVVKVYFPILTYYNLKKPANRKLRHLQDYRSSSLGQKVAMLECP